MRTRRPIDARPAARRAATAFACLLHAAWATADPAVASPLGGGDSVMLEPAPPAAPPVRKRAVFVCQDGGTPVYADRPCGPGSDARSLVVAMPPTGAVATTTPPSPPASTRPRRLPPRADAAPVNVQEQQCSKLQRQLDELNDRMRAGYSAREAARLWQRWRDAKERLRSARC